MSAEFATRRCASAIGMPGNAPTPSAPVEIATPRQPSSRRRTSQAHTTTSPRKATWYTDVVAETRAAPARHASPTRSERERLDSRQIPRTARGSPARHVMWVWYIRNVGSGPNAYTVPASHPARRDPITVAAIAKAATKLAATPISRAAVRSRVGSSVNTRTGRTTSAGPMRVSESASASGVGWKMFASNTGDPDSTACCTQSRFHAS